MTIDADCVPLRVALCKPNCKNDIGTRPGIPWTYSKDPSISKNRSKDTKINIYVNSSTVPSQAPVRLSNRCSKAHWVKIIKTNGAGICFYTSARTRCSTTGSIENQPNALLLAQFLKTHERTPKIFRRSKPGESGTMAERDIPHDRAPWLHDYLRGFYQNGD